MQYDLLTFFQVDFNIVYSKKYYKFAFLGMIDDYFAK